MAAVKVDKEFLIKNRFWISIPLAVVFFVIALIMALLVRGRTTVLAAEAVRTDGELKTMQGDTKLRNQMWIDAMTRETNMATAQKFRLWYEVYDRQNDVLRMPVPAPKPGETPDPTKVELGQFLEMRNPLVTWPREMHEISRWPPNRDQVPLAVRGFGEFFENIPQAEYKSAFDKQYDELLAIVDVMDETKKTGAVRALGNSQNHKENLRGLLKPITWGGQTVDYVEAWTAQEEIAVKRELLRALNDANNVLAVLPPEWSSVSVPDMTKVPEDEAENPTTETPPPPPLPAEEAGDKPDEKEEYKKVIDRKRYLNNTWQYGLVPFDERTRTGPSSNWYDGLLLQLELVPRGNDMVLKGVIANLSTAVKMVPQKLSITLSDGNPQRPAEAEEEVSIPELPPQRPGDEATKAMLSLSKNYLHFVKSLPKYEFEVKLNPVKFKDVKQIVRVSRPRNPANLVRDAQRFRNANWILDLELVPGASGGGAALQGKVYNRSGSRLKPSSYEVTLTDGREEYTETITVPMLTGPLNAWKDREVPKQDVKKAAALPPNRIVGVKQVLTWETAVIKRIDRIEMGEVAHKESDRTKVFPLLAYDFKKKDPKAPITPTDAAAAAPAGGNAPADASSGGFGALSAGGPSTGSRAGGNSANHGLPLKRYLEVTEELRRIPVAVVVRVDTENVNDVLTAFANARMRFRTTMSPWVRIENLDKPSFAKPGAGGSTTKPGGTGTGASGTGAAGGVAGAGAGGVAGAGAGGVAGAGAGSAGPSSPVGPGGSRAPTASVSSEDDQTQVELQIYGLITIYESPDAMKRLEEERKKALATTPAS